jgi:predicted secreted protein with PEFG-CTERM motif
VNYKILYVIISLSVISTGTAFADQIMVIEIDDKNYDEGDTIVISGKINTIVGDTPVIIQIIRDDTFVYVAQINVALDGTFIDTINAEGQLWKNGGKYTIRASYGSVSTIDLGFNYFTKSMSVEVTDSFEVNAGSYGTFDVPYSINGGIIKNMIVNSDNLGIDIEIDSLDQGRIVLELPREFIDAEKQNGKDESFIVLIDGKEVKSNETVSHADHRTLSINFDQGDSKIEIIGTFVIPEFGAIAMMIMIIGILTVIVISKNKLQIKI